ncbi:hypothetical protein ACFC1L_39945 [Streptomyces sp. NPDC056210]|uniref:hypothetical protein n=1 Tax=Streptomyces sp. NPDC056210 TaxID=3345746 RepID=UPI0035D6AC5B
MTEFLDYEETIPSTLATVRYVNGYRAYSYNSMGAIEFAQEKGWDGFALIVDALDSPVAADPSKGWAHLCQYAKEKANWETIEKLLNEFSLQGEGWDEWEGCIVYDYSSDALREAVEGIERAFSDSGYLDELRVDEIEREGALESLKSGYTIPDEVDASEVLSKIHDAGSSSCQECSSWDVEKVLSELGWRECADCTELLKTGTVDALCRDCADACDPVCEGECASVEIDATYSVGFMTADEIESIECNCGCKCGGLCKPCYEEKYPYARELAPSV